MRPDVHDAGYLLDMIQHARGILRSVKNKTLQDYLCDEDLRLAVERRVEIIGEAARRVSRTFQDAHPEIPWGKIIAQRNILTHEYSDIEDEIVWAVATVSIPELIELLEPLVPPL